MSEVSIIVPVYNKEKYIRNFIISVINQTFKDFELILVNDGSTDNSIEVAEEVLKNTDINYVIINKENKGQSSARNVGIKAASGKWIVIPDADDYLQKDYLKIMVDSTRMKDVDVVLCDMNSVTDDTISEENIRTNLYDLKKGREFFVDFILHKISIGPVSMMIKKKKLLDINLLFNEDSRYSEEFIFITYLLYNSDNIIHVKEKLYNYCVRKNSVSTGANLDTIINGYNEIVKASEFYKKENNEVTTIYNKFALPRWILATCRFSAQKMNYREYKELLKKLDAKQKVKKLYYLKDLKTTLAIIILEISPKIFYSIAK